MFRQKYKVRAPIEQIPQRQVIQKRPTTTVTKGEQFVPIERSLDMSVMDVSNFPDVVIMKPNQMSRFSRQRQDSYKKRNPKCKDYGGWGKGRYMHPKFRKGEFLEVDGLQVFQLTNNTSNSRVGGMLIHKPFAPKRFFAVSKQVSEQRNFDRDDTGSQDTNVGHKIIKAVRKDFAGARAIPPRPREYKGFLIPDKQIPLTYSNLDFQFNDDNFEFFGAEGSTVADDIYNFASFYEMVDNKSVKFIDDDIVADYSDLVTNYTNNRLSDSLRITNTFRFWGDARRFRTSHPLKSAINVISGELDKTVNSTSSSSKSSEQYVSFDADNLDDDSASSVGSEETIIETVVTTTVETVETVEMVETVETVTTVVPMADASLSSDDENEPFFPDSSLVECNSDPVGENHDADSPGLLELTIPVNSSGVASVASEDELPKSPCSTDDGFDLVVNTSFSPVATQKKAPLANRKFKLPGFDQARQLKKSNKRKRDETISVTEHEDVVDHILRERAEVGQENTRLRNKVKSLMSSVKELTLSDKKWKDRATAARYDLKFLVNTAAASAEIVSAGMALQGFQVLDYEIKQKAIKKNNQLIRNIRISPLVPDSAPECQGSEKCFSNVANKSKSLCVKCQFKISGSASVLLLQNAVQEVNESTKTSAHDWIEGPNFGTEDFDFERKEGHVIEVTQLPEVLKRRNLSVGSLVDNKRRQLNETSSEPKQPNREDSVLGQSTSDLDKVSEVNMPDLDLCNDFSQSTTNVSLEALVLRSEKLVVDIQGPNFVATDSISKPQGFTFGVQPQRMGPETPGSKLQSIIAKLVESGMANEEAAKFVQIVHTDLVKEVQKAQESDEKFSQ